MGRGAHDTAGGPGFLAEESAVSQRAVIIIGGGIAGLWLCDALRRRGDAVVLLEASALGDGQTIQSQGIIHGGVKYALAGALSESAANVGDMPARWLESLRGWIEPDLRGAGLRADHCHLWQTQGLSSGLGMLGARLALEVTPAMVAPAERPAVLRDCPGAVARLDEPVVDVGSVLGALAARNEEHLLLAEAIDFEPGADGAVAAARIGGPGGRTHRFEVARLVLTAGQGAAALRTRLGLDATLMQRRPLHMVMVRGALPELNGHCIDGAATRATITTVRDRQGRVVWLVGGLVAEQGVAMTPDALLAHARQELEATVPGLALNGTQWATWRVDRAERTTPGGRRPDDVQFLVEGNVITAWPTKLALAPRLADRLLDLIPPTPSPLPDLPTDWPRPRVAVPPWEMEGAWTTAG